MRIFFYLMAAAGAPDIEDADKVSFECVCRGNAGDAGGAQACGVTRCLGRALPVFVLL